MSESVRSHGFTALGPVHEAFARLRGWSAFFIAAFLGAVSVFAFAPFHITVVLVLSFTGLIWMLDGARSHRKWGKAVFFRAWAFGVGFFLVSMHWTAAPFLVEPEETLIFIWMPLVLLPAGMGLIWGAAASMAGAFWSASPSRIFIFALFFSLGEFVRGHLFGGFPWNLIGTSWSPGGAVSQAASLGGIYWLSLLSVFVFAAPAALVDTRAHKGLMERVLPSLAAVMLLAGGWAWGAQRISAPAPLSDQYVALIDSGVPQNQKFEVGADKVLSQYITMMNAGDGEAGDIVIWPEGAVPTSLLQDLNAMDIISAYLGPRTLIAGTARYNDAETWFNSMAVLDQSAARAGPLAIYDKYRLVPFGELPAARIIPFGQALSAILPDAMQRLASDGFEPGSGPAVITSANIPPFVALICYEGLYPEVTRRANTNLNAKWIATISNDAWFGGGMGPAQHYAQNRYRSIESGLPMARVASRGDSAIIDGYGREITRAKRIEDGPEGWKPVYVRARLPQALVKTVYQSRIGVVLLWLTICLFSGLAFLSWRR